jgi:uncharacterized protein YbaP (TraB family)
MKRFTCIRRAVSLIMGCLLASVSGVAAADEHPGKPFLWKIEGKELRKPSFLFGITYPPPPEGFHPQVEAAYAKCDVLMIEVPLDPEYEKKAIPLISRSDGKTLQEALGEDLANEVEGELKRMDPRLELVHFKDYKTWVMVWLLPSLKEHVMNVKTMSRLLADRASGEGKEIRPLATYEEQVAFFNTLSENDQRSMMRGEISKIKRERESGVDPRARSLDLYRAGDEAALLKEADASLGAMLEGEPELLQRIRKGVIHDWNILFSKRILENLEASPGKAHFIPFTTGNIVTEQGILARLSEAGFQITRIDQ